VSAAHQDSWLFIRCLVKLWQRYPAARVIQVIVDNYRIPSRRRVYYYLYRRLRQLRRRCQPAA
jgi:hypothetical protein